MEVSNASTTEPCFAKKKVMCTNLLGFHSMLAAGHYVKANDIQERMAPIITVMQRFVRWSVCEHTLFALPPVFVYQFLMLLQHSLFVRARLCLYLQQLAPPVPLLCSKRPPTRRLRHRHLLNLPCQLSAFCIACPNCRRHPP